MLQDLDYPCTKPRGKAYDIEIRDAQQLRIPMVPTIKDQVRVRLANRSSDTVRNIVAQHNIMQRKRDCRTMRKVRQRQRRRNTTMFMKKDQVAKTAGLC